MLEAAAAYLKSIGWFSVVLSVSRIQEQAPLSQHFELVIKFTGGQTPGKTVVSP